MDRRHASYSRTLVLCSLFAVCLSCKGSETPPEPSVWQLDLRASLEDGSARDAFSKPQASLYDALQRIAEAARSEQARALLLQVGPIPGAWGRVDDLIEGIEAYRATERPIHCHFDTADNVSYMLMARACDRISMTPAGTLDLVGPALVMFYARSLLETVGLEAQILHMGRYKGAGDMFIRDDMPPEARESLTALVDGMYASMAHAIRARTEGDANAVRKLVDQGPYTATDALEAGLIDAISFDDDALEETKTAANVQKVNEVRMTPKQADVSLSDLFSVFGGEAPKPSMHGPRVAIAYVTGNIVDGEQPMIREARSGPFVEAMRRFAKDDDVKAVVLRINSPGGSALASDRMWQAAREVAARKPVLASVGDMAASGGYYIASAAKEVFAHSSSLVGSIGVVGGKISIGKLSKRIGVNPVVLQGGDNAAWATIVRPLNDSERKAFEHMLRDTYNRFISRVATGRGMAPEKVQAAAEGRVMTGAEGKTRGLVDAIGGLGATLTRARELGQVGPEAGVEVWPPQKGILNALADALGVGEARLSESALREELALVGLPVSQIAALVELAKGHEHIGLFSPYLFEVR